MVACTAVCSQEQPIVVVISMDGVRWDYPDGESLRAFARMQREGLRAERLTPVYPSNTFPGHVSLATGAHPEVHGIVDNVFNDRLRGRYVYSSDASWLMAEPIWITAERQGVPAATYFWVGSESDWNGQGTRYRIAPFDGTRPDALKVAQILQWLALPEIERPRLIMSYFAGTDRVAHNMGPKSGRTLGQLGTQDEVLAELLNGIDELGLWGRLTLVLVSDHGMTPISEYISLEALLENAGIAAQVDGSTVGHVFLEDPADLERARQVLAEGSGLEVIRGSEAQARFRFGAPNRLGDLVVLSEPPIILQRPGGFEGQLMDALSFFGWDFGGHGFLPDLPDMGGIFLAMGRGVGEGVRTGAVHQIDVAPTIAHLLGIEPPLQAQGQVIPALLSVPDAPPSTGR